ncbi:MAG TPA: leucyl aminopeptidase, partial [candidate division Zixibacteria bacterium]|nr:leucyl aminopeptidase [candidate division Zixibacteria bacterium]
MDCRIAKGKYEDFKCDALISFQYQDGPGLSRSLGKLVKSAYQSGQFRGVTGELFNIYPLKGAKAPRLILVGLGKKANSNPEIIRKAAGLAIRLVRKLRTVAYLPIDDSAETIGPLIDGAILGDYRFDRLKSDKEESKIKTAFFFTNGTNVSAGYVKAAQVMAEGTCIARDLANLPANLLTPTALANEAKRLGKEYSIPVKVLDEAEMVRLKMGALLGVAQGSANRPKMVIWEYKGGKAGDSPIVLVGKGVTFDSGGISIKPADGMEAMKGDMGGAGAVISIMHVLGRIKPKVNVVGITPLVENMPSGTAYRPGDVLTASNGKTIEIISTDAEGRVILADALVYAKSFKPKYVVDIATLTGACMVALGMNIAGGLMGKDQDLVDLLLEAGQQTGERLWQLPLWNDYADLL